MFTCRVEKLGSQLFGFRSTGVFYGLENFFVSIFVCVCVCVVCIHYLWLLYCIFFISVMFGIACNQAVPYSLVFLFICAFVTSTDVYVLIWLLNCQRCLDPFRKHTYELR